VASRIVDRRQAGRLRRDVAADVIGDVVAGTYEAFARRMIDLSERPNLAAWARALLVVLYEGILERPGASASPLAAGRS
jgi:hypothetical protein